MQSHWTPGLHLALPKRSALYQELGKHQNNLSKVSDDRQSYELTKIVRQTMVELRYVQWTRVNVIVVGDAAFSGSPGDAQRIIRILSLFTDGVERPREKTWQWWQRTLGGLPLGAFATRCWYIRQ
jgi:hypothetical protein